MKLKTIFFAAASLALIATAASANPLGSSSATTVRTTVSYADLDIRHEPGASILLERIANAAVTLCGPASNKFGEVPSFHSCVDDAIARAVMKINSLMVTGLYRGQTGTTEIAKND